ncbi:hypothetical protein [Prochlorococcus sp. MIT 1223]|uniref:hypothetical protein n=1 Tax=Prochlorococcus sp. MIT 1223 TaxID=3096217 RepID=UPI002A74FAA3|nr:hypothetical protein [Prochlorococcus sp. MIT 1223]
MVTIDSQFSNSKRIDPIDDYLECITYCSVENFADGNDCQTICMERHLQGNYF